MDLISNLPKELGINILEYIKYPYPKIVTHYLIKEELYMYTIDHNLYHSRLTKKYFIRDILSFSKYYFDKYKNPQGYLRKLEDPY